MISSYLNNVNDLNENFKNGVKRNIVIFSFVEFL